MVVPSREVAVYMMVLRGSRGRLAWPLLPMLRMSDHGMDTASARAAGPPQWRPVSFTERHRGGFVQAECAYRSAARVPGVRSISARHPSAGSHLLLLVR